MNSNHPATRDAVEQETLESSLAHAFRLRLTFRTAYLLCDVHKLTIDEAAAILSISPAAVRIRLDRARRVINTFLLAALRG